jgi:hypothetical protein
MRRIWTIIGVRDVAGSFKWYQSLFGLPEAAPAHDDFGQILDSDGTVLLCLHEWVPISPILATACFCSFVLTISIWLCKEHGLS